MTHGFVWVPEDTGKTLTSNIEHVFFVVIVFFWYSGLFRPITIQKEQVVISSFIVFTSITNLGFDTPDKK